MTMKEVRDDLDATKNAKRASEKAPEAKKERVRVSVVDASVQRRKREPEDDKKKAGSSEDVDVMPKKGRRVRKGGPQESSLEAFGRCLRDADMEKMAVERGRLELERAKMQQERMLREEERAERATERKQDREERREEREAIN